MQLLSRMNVPRLCVSVNFVWILASLHLQAIEPSLDRFTYRGAGVLPVYKHHGKKWVILGRERWGKNVGTFDSFAGKRDKGERPTLTAARECAEELVTHLTMNLDLDQLYAYIDTSNAHTECVLADQTKEYVLFITKFDPYVDAIKRNFPAVSHKILDMKYKEKDKLAFVSWSNLEYASKQNSPTVPALVQEYNRKTQKTELHEECIELRPILAYMLKLYFNKKEHRTGSDQKIRFY
jgi:hypothetical protein